MSVIRSLLGVALALAAVAAAAQPMTRTALLIGNASYLEGPLRNPPNDVRAIAGALKELGFNVATRENLGLTELRETLRNFVLSTRMADVRVFYFAGHGLQMRGRNYLLPIDVELHNEKDVLARTADATELVEQLSGINTGANIVILDACRIHPVFTAGTRRLWAAMPGFSEASAPRGTLIAFSTGPGRFARDGEGPTSVYTRHFVRTLKEEPALPVEVFFKRVRAGVVTETRHGQVPWESSDIHGDLCFKPDTRGTCKQIQ